MITDASLVRELQAEIDRLTELERSRLMPASSGKTLLFRLAGIEYEYLESGEVDKAITAAGGVAQALERQDLEGTLTNTGQLIDNEEDDEDKHD
jgi:hypothetical protein